MTTRRKNDRQNVRLTAAQRAGDDPIALPDGRWYYAECDDQGSEVIDPARCEIWEKGADGRPVTWKPPATTAAWLDISTRWLRLLEARGLPARGHRDTCEYGWPHSGIWWKEYQLALRIGDDPFKSTKRLNMADAWARHDRQQAISEAETDYRIATDPLFAKYVAASEKNDHRLAMRLLEQLWARDGRPEQLTGSPR
ncbi:MAG TPA: hypothetical protein VF102_07155 [Gemmatimonadaceae bacterium]